MVDGIIDTSLIIEILRNNSQAVSWLANGVNQQLAITPIVWMETVQGATDKQKRQQVIKFLRKFSIEYPIKADSQWAMLQLARFSLSHRIDINDIMIADIAVRLAVPLYTLNVKHFSPLPNIQIVQPY